MTTQHTNFKTISGETQNYDFFQINPLKMYYTVSRDSISLKEKILQAAINHVHRFRRSLIHSLKYFRKQQQKCRDTRHLFFRTPLDLLMTELTSERGGGVGGHCG
jgi:hypothetical protein